MTGRQEYEMKIDNQIKNAMKRHNDNEILEDYFRYLSGHPASTRKQFINIVRSYFSYLEGKGVTITEEAFASIKPRDIDRWMESIRYKKMSDGTVKEIKEKTRKDKLIALSNFFGFLEANEYVDRNPCEKVQPPKFTEEMHVVALTEEEIKETIKRIEESGHAYRFRDAAIFCLMYRTGLRATAVSNINLEDIDLEEGEIRVCEKGNIKRTVYISTDTISKLKEWIAHRYDNGQVNNALFTEWTKRGKYQRISRNGIAEMLATYTGFTGKHITPHKLRSTCATVTYEKTQDIFLTAQVVGHSNVQNTRRYIADQKARKKEAAKLLDSI